MYRFARIVALAVAGPLVLARPTFAAESFEQPPAWSPSAVLAPAMVSGPNHRVGNPVRNDGIMNIYQLSSQFGALDAQSTAEAVKRIHEYDAIAALKKLESSTEFTDAFAAAGENVVEGGVDLITNPRGTISGAVSGVGAMLHRAGSSLSGPGSANQDSSLAALVGVSSKKREFAAELGVDVYSSNPLLQAALNRVARAAAVGNLTAGVALAAVGGAAGTVVSVTSGSESLNDILRETPPSDLRDMNRAKLEAMGISAGVTDLFINNEQYSLTYQTLLVDALDRMPGVADREAFVKVAVRTESDDLAMFRQRQARMYAAYDARVGKLTQMVALGTIAAARTADGKLLVLLPVDYIAWTSSVADSVAVITAGAAKAAPGAALELWLGGSASGMAQAGFKASGWKLQLDTQDRLLGPG